ncbi:MAG TPA: hypothetical protein VMG10_08050 [Gemmataceae bacterium]|nr:hypothetical protein [Gemmataceae bacterium]
MIWFACKQCGKRHGRGEHLAGTLVFCECGHGNRVPWSSTVPEPEPEEARPAPPPRPRVPRPAFDEDRPEPEFLRPRRSHERRRISSAYCLNHEETPKEATCEACHCSFCSACVVTLQGQTLCGPCKNFSVGGLNRPARISPLAIVAFVLGLVCVVVSLILTLAAVGVSVVAESGSIIAVVCCLIVVLLAGGELVLGWVALRQIDRQPGFGGRGLAMTGATAGLAGIVWAVGIAVFTIARQVQG